MRAVACRCMWADRAGRKVGSTRLVTHPSVHRRSLSHAHPSFPGSQHNQAWAVYEETREGAVSASRKLRALQVAVTLWAKSAWGKAEMRDRLEDMYVCVCARRRAFLPSVLRCCSSPTPHPFGRSSHQQTLPPFHTHVPSQRHDCRCAKCLDGLARLLDPLLDEPTHIGGSRFLSRLPCLAFPWRLSPELQPTSSNDSPLCCMQR